MCANFGIYKIIPSQLLLVPLSPQAQTNPGIAGLPQTKNNGGTDQSTKLVPPQLFLFL